LVAVFDFRSEQDIVDCWGKFVGVSKSLELETPKLHLMVHVNNRTAFRGNPWLCHTFLDESLNKELKKVLRLRHEATFETTATVKLSSHLEGVAKRMRRV
jgi:hypothetical protein